MNTFKVLKTLSLADISTIERPTDNEHLNLNSPAYEVFTDFNQHIPLMLEQSTSVNDAIALMKRTHVKLKLVIDSRESFRGVISLADLLSVRVMRAAQETGLSRNDLTVAQVMTRREALHAINVNDLASSRIGDLLATMKNFGDQHVLVVDPGKGSIRGMISASDIARRLHIPVSINARANSFSEVYQAIRA
jgi:CBS domain containing-hemolysin-like protein